MEKIKRDKLAVKIICTALAVILWFYVSYQENPSMTKTVRNVPIVITGEQALRENGFSVYSVSEKSVNVNATAKRLTLAKISNKTISAAINVSSIRKRGEYILPASVNASDYVNASYYIKSDDIKVIIEPIIRKNININAELSGTGDSNDIIRSIDISSKSVSVTAPESIMKSIKTIVPKPDSSVNIHEPMSDVPLAAIGKDGKIIDGVICSPSSVNITYHFFDTKSVPVVIKLPDESLLITETSVDIYGYGSEFDSIESITSVPIDDTLTKSSAKVKLNLPKGIKLRGSNDEITVSLPN